VVEGGEECDDGNATAGDGCEPGCCPADSDGDGRCDAHDPCTSPAPTDALVMFSGAGTNHHKFKLKGSVELPSAPVAFDPLANGVRIVVREAGVYLYDFTLPGGALASPPGYGWTANGARIWKFTGSVTGPYTGVPIFANVTSLKIARTTNMPNRLKFAV